MYGIFKKLCIPAIIYITFSMVHTLVAISNNDNKGALVQIILGILITLIIQLFCIKGMNIVSWIIVFLPFIFYTYIVLILYDIFGITIVYPNNYKYLNDKSSSSHSHNKMPNKWINIINEDVHYHFNMPKNFIDSDKTSNTHKHKNLPERWK